MSWNWDSADLLDYDVEVIPVWTPNDPCRIWIGPQLLWLHLFHRVEHRSVFSKPITPVRPLRNPCCTPVRPLLYTDWTRTTVPTPLLSSQNPSEHQSVFPKPTTPFRHLRNSCWTPVRPLVHTDWPQTTVPTPLLSSQNLVLSKH